MGLFSFISFFSGCGAANTKNPTKFDWYATESAPKLYPKEIIRGTFLTKVKAH